MLDKSGYIVILFLLFQSVFTLNGCEDGGFFADERKKYRVGLSQCANDTYWRKQMNNSIKANATQSKTIELIKITDGENSSSNQIQDIKDLVHEKIDLLMVSPNEADSLVDIISEVMAKDIPVILIDRKINSDNYTTFIGADNTEIGGKAADYLNLLGNGRVDILELHGQAGASAAQERSFGFNSHLDKKKNFHHTGDLYCNWSRCLAREAVAKFWQEGGRCNVIYSHNDDMAIGAWEALDSLGVDTDSITIIGTDGAAGENGGIKAVIDKKIDVTFFYPDGNEEAIEFAEKILSGHDVPKQKRLSTVQIDGNNAEGLLGQMMMSRRQEDRIIAQNETIAAQSGQISGQRIWLALISFGMTIFVVMFIITMRLYRKDKLHNVQLNEKNAEINAQKEELENQAVYLSQMNEQLRISKENTLGSIRSAQTIQNALLPTEENLNVYFNAFIIYSPKDIVSGDFYWYGTETNGAVSTYIIGVIDCTGHGVPGAFMSLIGINLLDQIIKQYKITSPAEILARLNAAVRGALKQEETENNDGMEAALCRIEVETEPDGITKKYTLTYEGAKIPVCHYKKSEDTMEIYKTARREIGGKFRNIESTVVFENHTIGLSKGDRLYMFSDGIGDQNNYERKRYSSRRLVSAIQESVSLNMHEQRDYIWNDLKQFKGDCIQRDDITVMGIEIV
ncbi:MAG: substrate-binding domain-containing protein [Bacteroidales bacterium]|nr:substrate-binding domain-containing protein [Bacteroidales bacterium]